MRNALYSIYKFPKRVKKIEIGFDSMFFFLIYIEQLVARGKLE